LIIIKNTAWESGKKVGKVYRICGPHWRRILPASAYLSVINAEVFCIQWLSLNLKAFKLLNLKAF